MTWIYKEEEKCQNLDKLMQYGSLSKCKAKERDQMKSALTTQGMQISIDVIGEAQ